MTSLKESLTKKNLATLFQNIIQRPVNILLPIGIVVIVVAILTFLFENFAWDDLFFILLLLGFAYWGYQHGQVDRQAQSEHSVHYWKIAIALLGLITIFGIYLTLAMAFKYDFQIVFEYILIRFGSLGGTYVLCYGIGYITSAN